MQFLSSWKVSRKASIASDFSTLLRIKQGEKRKQCHPKSDFRLWQVTYYSTKNPINKLAMNNRTLYPASRGYIFAVWAGVRKVASADKRSIFYRACAKFVTRFASNWLSARVSRESNLRKLLSNNSPPAFVLFFCFAPSGFKYFSGKISTDRLF